MYQGYLTFGLRPCRWKVWKFGGLGNARYACAGVCVADLACKPLPEFEAELTIELDRLQDLANHDPLNALDKLIGIMQGLNLEVVKALAPALVENTQLRAAKFLKSGNLEQTGRTESRALTSLQRTEATLVKLGVARVKVRDEIDRRRSVEASDR